MRFTAAALHKQSACQHGIEMLAARDKGHVRAGLGQRRPKPASDAARADHRDPHNHPLTSLFSRNLTRATAFELACSRGEGGGSASGGVNEPAYSTLSTRAA